MARHIPLDFKVLRAPDLLPGYDVTFTAAYADSTGLRIEYAIAPPVPLEPGSLSWVGVIRDESGETREDVGGAFGLSSEGRCTQGVMTFELATEGAGEVYVRLAPAGRVSARKNHEAYELVIRRELRGETVTGAPPDRRAH